MDEGRLVQAADLYLPNIAISNAHKEWDAGCGNEEYSGPELKSREFLLANLAYDQEEEAGDDSDA